MKTFKILALSASAALGVSACTTTSPQSPAPRPAAAPAAPKAPEIVQPVISQTEAEQLCTLKAVKKFGGGLGDIRVTDTAKVDAGYRIRLSVGGQERNCIISPQGDLRSLV